MSALITICSVQKKKKKRSNRCDEPENDEAADDLDRPSHVVGRRKYPPVEAQYGQLKRELVEVVKQFCHISALCVVNHECRINRSPTVEDIIMGDA